MEDEFRNTTNPRDPNCYGPQHAARPGVPPANAADDIAFAILKLLREKPRWRFFQNRVPAFPRIHQFTPGVQGVIFANPPLPRFRSHWFLDGRQMNRGELNSIEVAFEGFINNLEWENE